MPTYVITAPNGKEYEIDAPQGASQEQALSYFQQNWEKQQGKANQPETNALSAFGAGLGKGVGGVALTAQDLLGRGLGAVGDVFAPEQTMSGLITGNQPQNVAQRASKWLREDAAVGKAKLAAEAQPYAEQHPIATGAGEIGAEVLATIPVGGVLGKAASMIPQAAKYAQALRTGGFDLGAAQTGGRAANSALRVGSGAAVGGASAGLVNPEDAGMGAVLGAAVGAAAPVITKGLSRLGRIANPTEAELAKATLYADESVSALADDLGVTVSDLPAQAVDATRKAAVEAFKKGEKLDAAALFRKGEFEKLGIKPLQSQLTRDPNAFAQERNLRGVSPEIQGRLQEQNTALQKLFAQPAGGAKEAYQAGEQMIPALKSMDDSMRKNISALYTQARESAGKDLEIPMQGLAQDFADTLDNFGDKVPSGVVNQFKNYGLLGGQQTKLFTIEESDRLLKVINANQSNDPAVNAALANLRDAVKKSVLSVDATGGPFAPAVAAARDRFKTLEKIPALEAAANGTVNPEKFVQKYISQGGVDDVKELAKALRVNAPDVFDQAKSQMAEDIRRAAFGEGITGDAAIRPEMLAKKLREFGTEKMSAFFSPAEIERYQTAMRVANYIEKHPNAAPVNTSNTLVAQLMNPAVRVLDKIPGGGVAVAGAKAVAGAVNKEMAVGKAMKANIPIQKLDLTPSQSALLAKALGRTSGGISSQIAE